MALHISLNILIRRLVLVFSAAAAGALITLSLAPFDQWYFGVLGCLLLLIILDKIPTNFSFWIGWVFGIGLFGFGISWISVSIDLYGGASFLLAWALTLLFCTSLGLFYAIFSYIYKRWIHSNPMGISLGFPALWVIFEWLRSWVFSGFPWLYLGYGHLETPLSGYAPIGSVFSISFLCVFTASLSFLLILKPQKVIKLAAGCSLLVIWIGGLMLKNIEWTSSVEENPLNTAIYQPNIPQEKKWDWRYRAKIKEKMANKVNQIFDHDLIILPEAAIPDYFRDSIDLLTPIARKAEEFDSTVLIGIPTLSIDGKKSYNSILSLGVGQGIYHKRQLVPFGEYVPFENQLRGLIEFFDLPMSNFVPGTLDQSLFSIQDTLIAPFICYEIAYAKLVLKEAKKAGIVVTLSNDSWFGKSIGPHQHLQIARMRALETGRFVIRATNNGISAIINPKGVIVTTVPQFKEAVLTGKVYPMRGITPASSLGVQTTLGICWTLLLFIFCRSYFIPGRGWKE